VPQCKLRQALMHGAHYALVAGHLGVNKAYERLMHVEFGSVPLLSLVLSIRVMLEILVETTA
jgi:hypothetical protein